MTDDRDAASFRFVDQGEGRVLSLKGDAIVLAASVPSPPGSRREATLVAAALPFRVKIHASRKQADGTFILEGRLFDATKAVIEALTTATAPKA
jgi:hypothetical protein